MARPPLIPPRHGEVFVPFPTPIVPLRNVRSTIIVASVANVKAAGLFTDYASHVAKEHHEALFDAHVGGWTPLNAAMAHYAACDTLGLSELSQREFGRKTVERIGRTMVGTGIRMARQAGIDPWTFFGQLHRFWSRGYDGGGIAVYKLGPKDAQIQLVEFSLCASPFFRCALFGWFSSFTEMFCARLFMREERATEGPSSMTVRAQWV